VHVLQKKVILCWIQKLKFFLHVLTCISILTALKDLVDNILFSIIIIEAYLVKGGKFSNTQLLSGCIREECGTQSSASSVVCLKFTIPIPNRPHTTMQIMIVKMGCKATVLPSLQIKYNKYTCNTHTFLHFYREVMFIQFYII
jgi:hypothetical protein